MRFLFLAVILFASTQLLAQTCDVQVITTDVSCYGESNGTAKVVVNGQVIGNPQGCLPADAAPATYTTGCTRTYSENSGNVEINPGEQVCLSGSNFTGGIQAKGGTLVITGNATPSQMNLSNSNPGFTLIVMGTAQFSSLNLFGNSTVKNYGTLTVPSVGFNGTLENNGVLAVNGDLDINAPNGNFTNKGTVTVSSNFNIRNTTLNGGTITINGLLNINSSGILDNLCTVLIAGNFNNNTKTINRGKITAGGTTAFNEFSIYQGYAGSVLTTGRTTIDGIVQGMSGSCAAIKVTGEANVNDKAIFSGAIDYCAPNGSINKGRFVAPSTMNCSCTSISATYAWQSPLSGTTDNIRNLEAKTYTVIVTPQGCPAETKIFTIGAPGVLSAVVTTNGLSATASISGGTAPFKYVWSGNQSTLASVSYATSGTYTLQVTDSKDCTTSQSFTVTAPPVGNCVITVETKNPTCAGSNDGSATIYLNGNVLGTGISGSGVQTPVGCSVAQTSTYNCTTSCTQTVNDNTANITVGPGQQVCLTATGYTGNITVTGGTLIICGKSTPQNINYTTNGAAFTLVVNGELTLSHLNLPANCTLKNYGKVTYTSSASYDGHVENYGTMASGGDFNGNNNNNSNTSAFFNYGSLTVNANLNIGFQGTNNGTLNIVGTLQLNEGSTFTNNCTIQIGDVLINNKNANLNNAGTIVVAQWTRLNGLSTTTLSPGSSINTQHITMDGTVTGSGTSCSALKVTGQSIVNGNAKLQGKVSMCIGTGSGTNTFTGTVIAPATINCSCVLQPIEYSSPLLGMSNPYQGLPADTYTVKIQPEGCPVSTETFTIKNPDPIIASVVVIGKKATVTASGGEGILIYTWSDGSSGTIASHTFANNGSYQVTISDSKNCLKVVSFNVPQIENPNTCCSKLLVEYIAVNQVRFTSSCSSTVAIINGSGIAVGNVLKRPLMDSILQVKTGENCLFDVLVKGLNTLIVDPTDPANNYNPLIVTGTVIPESCIGKKDGVIQLSISGGSGEYSISNDYTANTNSPYVGNLGAGIVQVQVLDSKTGYLVPKSFTVPLKPSNSYQLVANSYTATGEVASVKIQVSGGNSTANTTINWGSLGGSGLGPIAVPNWIYPTGFVTATLDESGSCRIVLELPVVKVCASSFTPLLNAVAASCSGSNTGQVSISNLPSGASIAWSGTPNPSSSAVVTDLLKGTYRADIFLTLSNGNKCLAGSGSVSVTEPTQLNANVIQQPNTTNYTAQVSGGVGPYTYEWTNGAQTPTASLITAGVHRVNIRDSKGCMVSKQVNIPLAPCANGVSLDISQLSCAVNSKGNITASSAISGASYYWTSVAPATAISNPYNNVQENLEEGLYIVSVKGWNPECISRTGVRLKKPAALTAVSKQVGNTVNIVVSNGTPNYKVVWRLDSLQTDSRSDLTPGVQYTVDITDSKGCKLEHTFVYDPCALNPVVALIQMQNNKATPQVSGGTAPYSYLWTVVIVGSNALSTPTSAVQTNLEGTYRLTVSDVRGCSGTLQVTGPNCGMNAIDVLPTATTCATACDGKAVLSGTIPTGAVIRWDNLATAFSFVNACAGNHTVQIKNAQGCYIKKDVFIPNSGGICPDPNPENPKTGSCTLDAVLQAGTSKLSKQCFDEQANIDIKITGGFAPFRMKWDVQRAGTTVTETFATDKEDYSNAQPGIYTFYITDQRECSKTVTTNVSGPAGQLSSSVSLTQPICAENYAGFRFEISGGQGPYSIRETGNPSNPLGSAESSSFAASGELTAYTLAPAQAGSYTYEITDALGCKVQNRISLPAIARESIRFSGGITASQTRLRPGQTALLSPRSVSGYTSTWNDQPTAPVNRTVSQSGTYVVTYSKANCQSYTRSVSLTAILPGDTGTFKSALCIATQPIEIPVDTEDRCLEYKRLSAEAFGHYRYELYVAAQKDSIRNKYVKAVMGTSVESLVIDFSDKEEHYTLYYYDQSGNLVRTIPPSGVKPLNAQETAQAIVQMKSGNSKVLTKHDYTTTYAYNSLNQLVHQDIPDHNRMDLWQTDASSVSLNNATVAAVAYNPQGNNGLMLANTTEKAQFLSTADAGKTWQNNQNIGLGRITAISRVTGTNLVFAGGTDGTFLRSENGGRSWTLLPLTTQVTVKKVSFTDLNTGWIITQDGNLYGTTDAGVTWTLKPSLKSYVGTGMVADAAVSKTSGNIWVLVSNGKIYQSINDGSSWTERTVESPTVNTVALNGTELTAAGSKGTLFKAGVTSANLTVTRTGLDKTISKILPLGGNTYYALTSDGLVYYSTTPLAWTQVGSISAISEITTENALVLAYTGTGVRVLTGSTSSGVVNYTRVAAFGASYVGLTAGNALYVLNAAFVQTGSFTVTGLEGITVKDMFVIGTKLIILDAVTNNVYEGDVIGANIVFTATATHTGISSFVKQGTNLYVRTSGHTVIPYGSINPSITLSATTTDVVLSSASGGYAVESGKVRKIAGGILTDIPALIPKKLTTVTADGSKTWAAGENGELYVSTGTNFSYVPVVDNASNYTDAAYSATQGRLELITATTQHTYNETTATLTTSGATYSSAVQISTTSAAGQVLAAAVTGSPVTGQTTYSVEGNSTDTYLAGADAGKIWYKESSASAYVSATVNIKPLASVAYATATTVLTVGQQGTILRSADKGASWQMVYSGTANNLTQVSAAGNTAVAIGAANTVLYSSNGGQSWNAASGVPTAATSVKVTPSVVLITAGTSIYKSINGGQNFTAESGITASGTLRSVWLDSDGYGFAVGDAGAAYRITPLTATTFTYTKILTDATPNDDKGTGLPVAAFKTVQFSDRLTGYITGANNLILKTVDGGAHWKSESIQTAGAGTPQLALSSDAQRGTLIDSDGSVQTLNDQAEQFNSRFWYDELGRLVLSQNAKQFSITDYEDETIIALGRNPVTPATVRAYSYTRYDKIGRIIEVGEVLTDQKVATYKNESQVQYANHEAFVGATAAYKHQRSITTYDRNVTPPQGFAPTYLRNRVAYTTYQQTPNSAIQATHYSYDVHGNVNSLLQVITHDGNVLAKTVDYEYDLISGKVNKVYYQKAKTDQLIHQYAYDGDNRITEVKTSTDDVLYTKEATYQYYAHGPLARTTTGELNVETQNYAYTVQGWIKQMQAEAFSYALGYNEKDYTSIGATASILSTPISRTSDNKSKGLYNGNIASMTSNTPRMTEVEDQPAILQQQYSYDQLNRITASNTPGAIEANAYKTSYSYDANGNIQTLVRYDGRGAKFDELAYNYENKAKGYLKNTNKLRWVDDVPELTAVKKDVDVDDQSTDNYSYDAIGNLIADDQEQIANIEWTVSGKVKRVTRTINSSKPDLEFEYDASGQRIVKKVIKKDGEIISTYYLRDASGNVMSVYVYNSLKDNTPLLSEQYLYGSSRIGVATPGVGTITNADGTKLGSRSFGRKSYELSDHLGNVRATLSDYRRAASQAIVNSATDYYPFGMAIPGRQYTSSNIYRYGQGTQEKDTEIGEGIYTALYWEYDSRLGRRWNLDPKPTHSMSSYSCFLNNPVLFKDINGDKVKTKLDKSLRKELNLTKKQAKEYTPDQLKQTFREEYGIEVVIKKGWLIYAGESDKQPENFSAMAKKIWMENLGEKKSPERIKLFYNKTKIDVGENNPVSRTTNIDLYDFKEDLTIKGITEDANNPFKITTRTFNLGRVLEHEFICHGLAGYIDDYPELTYYTNEKNETFQFDPATMTGETVDLENVFRWQAGIPLRINYSGRKVIDGKVYGYINFENQDCQVSTVYWETTQK